MTCGITLKCKITWLNEYVLKIFKQKVIINIAINHTIGNFACVGTFMTKNQCSLIVFYFPAYGYLHFGHTNCVDANLVS